MQRVERAPSPASAFGSDSRARGFGAGRGTRPTCRHAHVSPPGEILPAHDTRAFPDHHELVRGHRGNGLPAAVRPTDVQVGLLRRAEAEMQPLVAGRKETRLAENFLRLHPVAVSCRYPRSDGTAVRSEEHTSELQSP